MNKIVFSESGQGNPVIFLHGFCESKELWKNFESHLSSDFRVILLDLPGFGESLPYAEDFSLEDIADNLNQWTSDNGLEKFTLIGHSLGGYITLAFAKKYPEKVDAIGLFHSSIFEDTTEKKDNRSKTIEFINKNSLEAFIDNFVPNLFFKERHTELKEVIDMQKVVGNKTNKAAATAYMAAMRERPDSVDFAKSFDKPALIIAGVHDNSVPFEKSEEMATCFPDATAHFLQETGHMGMFEREKDTLIYLGEFLKKVYEKS